MKKIINYCKNKYKTLIPLMVVLVLLITVYFLYKEYKFDNTREKKDYEVSQYFGGVETNYTMTVTYNLNKQIVSIKEKDNLVEYDSTPVYFKEENKVLFPREMTIVFPLDNGNQYKIYKYSIYDGTEINTNSYVGEYNNFFLYDGDGLYFFPNEVTLYIDNKEYIKLGDMSYVSISGGYTMIYYNNEEKEAKLIDIEGKKISVKSDKINVNLSNNSFTSFSNNILLLPPNNLKAVYKTD